MGARAMATGEIILHSERGSLSGFAGSNDHIDVAVFGALQVSANGDLASELGPGRMVKTMNGATLDDNRVVVMMEHTDWRGRPRIVGRLTLPLVAKGCVDRIITDLAVIEFEIREGRRGLVLRELVSGVSIARVVEATGAPLRIPSELIRPGSTL
jgi:3-oxoacid CoA-transferase subunit B